MFWSANVRKVPSKSVHCKTSSGVFLEGGRGQTRILFKCCMFGTQKSRSIPPWLFNIHVNNIYFSQCPIISISGILYSNIHVAFHFITNTNILRVYRGNRRNRLYKTRYIECWIYCGFHQSMYIFLVIGYWGASKLVFVFSSANFQRKSYLIIWHISVTVLFHCCNGICTIMVSLNEFKAPENLPVLITIIKGPICTLLELSRQEV